MMTDWNHIFVLGISMDEKGTMKVTCLNTCQCQPQVIFKREIKVCEIYSQIIVLFLSDF